MATYLIRLINDEIVTFRGTTTEAETDEFKRAYFGGNIIAVEKAVIQKWARDIAREELSGLVGEKPKEILGFPVRLDETMEVGAIGMETQFAPKDSKHYLAGKLIDSEDVENG